ncbi:ABC transporter permease [Salinisphaera sp. RV14]|uniref:ABC transporter permease n=1 Tax=unclassified Salinisphaera TaxID=2649847 RepID=UPI003F82C402
MNNATEAPASGEQHQGPLRRVQHFLHGNPAAVPIIVVILSVIFFSIAVGSRFYSAFALTLILQQVAITGIVGAGETLIILTAGIDLSVGAIMVLSSVVMGQFAMHYGVPGFVAVLAGLGVGGICGLLSGLLVSVVKLPPFIVTLGAWSVYGATTYIYSGNETVRSQDIDRVAPILHLLGNSFRIGNAVFTYGVVLMVALALALWFALNHTAWGRHVYAVGDDKDAALLAGIRTGRVLVSVYVVAGVICGLAGWTLIGRIGAISPQAGQMENIEAITAVVIGGTSLFGGRGSIIGTLFGALIVGVFSLGLRLLGTDPQWTQLAVGALIIIAVTTDQWIRKISA